MVPATEENRQESTRGDFLRISSLVVAWLGTSSCLYVLGVFQSDGERCCKLEAESCKFWNLDCMRGCPIELVQ